MPEELAYTFAYLHKEKIGTVPAFQQLACTLKLTRQGIHGSINLQKRGTRRETDSDLIQRGSTVPRVRLVPHQCATGAAIQHKLNA